MELLSQLRGEDGYGELTMGDHIEREAAIDALNALKPFLHSSGQERLMRRAIRAVGAVPLADVAPVVHAKWAHIGFACFQCPNCGHFEDAKRKANFCWFCGADMREDVDNG